MTNHGDDCYFFYYSTCTKGDSCPFRHCEAAMGNETVCNLWEEGRCFRTVCKFRHMEITKKRKEIACYWENHPAGCQKPHCAFFHERPRYIDGTFFPPDKSQHKAEEMPNEEPAPPTAPPLQAAANPQLRGVIKTENQEPVPSPTHPPVVINPADDDEDEDDQFSEEGEDGKVGPSPRKLARSSESLNVGVSTLQEIRLRRSLKASMRRADGPNQTTESTANGGKENIRAFFRASRHIEAPLEDVGRSRSAVTDRLGRKTPSSYPSSGGEGVPMKRSLAERLGRIVDTDELTGPPQKALKTVKERLRLNAEATAVSPAAESSTASKTTPELIRIKTLEEIRQEKAAKSQRDNSLPDVSEVNLTRTVPAKATKGVKRSISVKDQQIGHVKTFSEILHAKKRRQEEQQEQDPAPKLRADKAVAKPQEDLGKDGLDPQAARAGEVRVKTLEEIRREKAARSQVQDTASRSSDPEKAASQKPRVITKPPAPSDVTAEKAAPVQPKPHQPPKAAAEPRDSSSGSVQVKSFEEIMREKRLRKQETVTQASGSSRDTAQAPPSTAVDVTLKRQVRKLLPLRSKAAASPANGSAAPHATPSVVTTVTAEGSSTPSKGPSNPSKGTNKTSRAPNKTTCNSTISSTVKQARAAQAAPCPPADAPQPTEKKVRPKLNVKPSVVKPSVVKPAAPVKPRQKRKGAERSAVAAIKPLNSSAPEDLDKQVLPSSSAEAQLNAAVPRSPTNLLESSSSSSPLREEQTVPVFKQSPRTETRLNVSAPAPRQSDAVPQSPNLKTQKSRRQSVASPRISDTFSTDDFEELINEFTDDHLDEDVDPGIAEDDLLQELTDMIDS